MTPHTHALWTDRVTPSSIPLTLFSGSREECENRMRLLVESWVEGRGAVLVVNEPRDIITISRYDKDQDWTFLTKFWIAGLETRGE